MWEKFHGKVSGVIVSGDHSVAPTRWWNHLYLLWFRWKKVTVLRVPSYQDGYHLGYVPFKGSARLQSQVLTHKLIRVRNGYEDCIFFATNAKGEEVKIEVVIQTNMDDQSYKDVPLL